MCTNGLMVEHWPQGIPDDRIRLALYALQQGSVLAGFLIVSLSPAVYRKARQRSMKWAMLVIYILSSLSVMLTGAVSLRAVFIIMISICIGMTGAMVYALLSMETDFNDPQGRRNIGSIIGVGGTAALLLQWGLQNLPEKAMIPKVILLDVLMYCVLSRLNISGVEKTVPEGDTTQEKGTGVNPSQQPVSAHKKQTEKGYRKKGICLCIAVCSMLMLLAIYESHMNRVDFAGYFYEWTRILTAVGYLTIGFLFGRCRRGVVSAAMSCIALVSVISSFLMIKSGEGWWLHMALFYMVLGSLVAYYNLMFMEYAVQTIKPVLWASMGRILDAAITTLFTVFGAILPGTEISILVMSLVLLAMLTVSMTAGGLLSMEQEGEEKRTDTEGIPVTAVSIEDQIKQFKDKYGLTDRETEVLRLLVTTENKNQQIADELFISRRQLQNHISSIYEKTGASTRAGLLMMIGE